MACIMAGEVTCMLTKSSLPSVQQVINILNTSGSQTSLICQEPIKWVVFIEVHVHVGDKNQWQLFNTRITHPQTKGIRQPVSKGESYFPSVTHSLSPVQVHKQHLPVCTCTCPVWSDARAVICEPDTVSQRPGFKFPYSCNPTYVSHDSSVHYWPHLSDSGQYVFV